eukprot:scaffold1328_cov162-Amphora_coffeaeformis.AAC.26
MLQTQSPGPASGADFHAKWRPDSFVAHPGPQIGRLCKDQRTSAFNGSYFQRVILHTIGFELSIDHPYPFILEQISKLVNGKKVEPRNAAAGTNPSVFTKLTGDWKQYAMNFANDSMQTSLCLQFPPQKIASAMVFLAALFIKVQPTAGRDWPDILEHGDVETLASITLQVLELIQERKNVHTETFEKIKIEIIKLRDNKDSSMEPQAKRIREG